MARIQKKLLKLGTGTGELNARDLSANFSPSNYVPTQVASEGTDKISAHLSGIDAALVDNIVVVGDISPTTVSLSNNVATPTSITGLLFDSGTVRSAVIQYFLEVDADTNYYESGQIFLTLNAGGWDVVRTTFADDTGIEFTITAGGQVQYTSPNFTGFVSSEMRFRASVTPSTNINLLNNQASPIDISDLAFSDSYRSVIVQYSVYVDATTDYYDSGQLFLTRKNGTWALSQVIYSDDSQVTFSITNAGQVQYTTPNYAGFSAATIRYRYNRL